MAQGYNASLETLWKPFFAAAGAVVTLSGPVKRAPPLLLIRGPGDTIAALFPENSFEKESLTLNHSGSNLLLRRSLDSYSAGL